MAKPGPSKNKTAKPKKAAKSTIDPAEWVKFAGAILAAIIAGIATIWSGIFKNPEKTLVAVPTPIPQASEIRTLASNRGPSATSPEKNASVTGSPQESVSANPVSSPSKEDSFVETLNLRANSYVTAIDSVIDEFESLDTKDSAKGGVVKKLQSFKKQFQELQAKHVEAVIKHNDPVTHELVGEIHSVQEGVLNLVNSHADEIKLRWQDGLKRRYLRAPEPGEDKDYDGYVAAVVELDEKTVSLLDKNEYPQGTPGASPELRP